MSDDDLIVRLLRWGIWLDSDLGTDEPAGADCREAAARIASLTAKVARLAEQVENTRAMYENLEASEILAGYKNRAEAAEAEVASLRAENKKLREDLTTSVWSDSEECKLLTRINAALIEAPTVDVNVVVPDRDYSAMTPKDCYEVGLLDGIFQAREAIKAASRAALSNTSEPAP